MIFDGDLIGERARITPGKLALVYVETGERLTYADFDQRVDDAAVLLSSIGITAGDRYGILALNSIDYLALFFAAGRLDAIVVPLSTRATAHELEAVVADCGMKALLHSDDFAPVAGQLPTERFSIDLLREAQPPPRTTAEIHDP